MNGELVINGVVVTTFKKWALTLMEREARGEQLQPIAEAAWREVFGYPRDMDAKEALAGVKAKAAA